MLVDEAGDGGTERLLLLRSDPDQIPAKNENTPAVSQREALDIDHAIGGRSNKSQKGEKGGGEDVAARRASLTDVSTFEKEELLTSRDSGGKRAGGGGVSCVLTRGTGMPRFVPRDM